MINLKQFLKNMAGMLMALPLMALLKEEGAIDEPVSPRYKLDNDAVLKLNATETTVGIGTVSPSTKLHIVQHSVPLHLDQADLSVEFIRFNSIT